MQGPIAALFPAFENGYIKDELLQVSLVVKNMPASAGDFRNTGLIPRLGRSPGGGHGNPLNILAWRIPWTEEPGGPWSLGLHRVRQK